MAALHRSLLWGSRLFLREAFEAESVLPECGRTGHRQIH